MENTENSRRMITAYSHYLLNEHDPWKAFGTFFGKDMVQHDPDIADGNEGDEEFLEGRHDDNPDDYLPTDQYSTIVHAIFADDDLVAIKSHVFTSRDDEGRLFLDIWRTKNNKFVEHWAAIEPIPDDEEARAKLTCGVGLDYEDAATKGDTVAAPVSGPAGDPGLREASLATVRAFVDLVQDPARIDEAVERYLADDFVEFSPRAKGYDRKAAAEHLRKRAARGETFEEARHMADGSLVLIHGRAFTGEHPLGYSQMHLYRVADGKITAHWSIRQEIPEYSVAGRCMVQGPLEEGRHKGGPRPGAGH